MSVTKSPPLNKDTKLSSRSENQKPAASAGAGVQRRAEGTTGPNLRRILPEDLACTHRLLLLFAQAAGRGLVRLSDSDRLRFVAAAEHAKAVGRHNPCGLFATIVRKALWRFISQGDEDSARQRLHVAEMGEGRGFAWQEGNATGVRGGGPEAVRDILPNLVPSALRTAPFPAL